MLNFKADHAYSAEKNTVLGPLKIEELTGSKDYSAEKAWINIGGWQSWSPGFEIKPGEKQENLTCHIVRPFNKYLTFPNSAFKSNKNIVLGHFVIYLRWDNFYLVIASTGNLNKSLPPVQFIINRKENDKEKPPDAAAHGLFSLYCFVYARQAARKLEPRCVQGALHPN